MPVHGPWFPVGKCSTWAAPGQRAAGVGHGAIQVLTQEQDVEASRCGSHSSLSEHGRDPESHGDAGRAAHQPPPVHTKPSSAASALLLPWGFWPEGVSATFPLETAELFTSPVTRGPGIPTRQLVFCELSGGLQFCLTYFRFGFARMLTSYQN